jgi:hypothetical protein
MILMSSLIENLLMWDTVGSLVNLRLGINLGEDMSEREEARIRCPDADHNGYEWKCPFKICPRIDDESVTCPVIS